MFLPLTMVFLTAGAVALAVAAWLARVPSPDGRPPVYRYAWFQPVGDPRRVHATAPRAFAGGVRR